MTIYCPLQRITRHTLPFISVPMSLCVLCIYTGHMLYEAEHKGESHTGLFAHVLQVKQLSHLGTTSNAYIPVAVLKSSSKPPPWYSLLQTCILTLSA